MNGEVMFILAIQYFRPLEVSSHKQMMKDLKLHLSGLEKKKKKKKLASKIQIHEAGRKKKSTKTYKSKIKTNLNLLSVAFPLANTLTLAA